jgi:hypothetical protein
MTNVGQFAYNTLKNSTALTALVPVASIQPSRPERLILFPAVFFSDDQHDIEFVDNHPKGTMAEIIVDVYVQGGSPYAICKVICDLMDSLLWACMTNVDAPDPDTAARHRHLIFSRPLLPGDI